MTQVDIPVPTQMMGHHLGIIERDLDLLPGTVEAPIGTIHAAIITSHRGDTRTHHHEAMTITVEIGMKVVRGVCHIRSPHGTMAGIWVKVRLEEIDDNNFF